MIDLTPQVMASATQRGSGEPVTATVTSKNGGHLINTGQQLNVNVKNTSHPGGSVGIGTDRSNSFGSRVHHHHHVHHVHHVHYQEPYELSQDLVAKQLELLEKKYGGASKANEAALTITRAFRRSVHTYFLLIFFRISRIYILVG